MSQLRLISIVGVITVVVAVQLYRTAAMTGNYEGLWFSFAHTLLVAVGVVCALRTDGRKLTSPE